MNKYLFLIASLLFLMGCEDDEETNPSTDTPDEFAASVSVSSSVSSITENAGSFTFSISLSEQNTSESTLTIPFTLSGTATVGTDYDQVSQSAAVAVNANSATVTVSLIDDSEVEGDETITITLGSLPENITAGSTTSATVTVTDDDEEAMDPPSATITFGNSSGNSLSVASWTDVGADSYLVVINTENTFTNFSDQESQLASSTYVGFGEQVVYNSGSISAFDVSLLSSSSTYYFKVIPVTSGAYDNSQAAANASTTSCETTSTTIGEVCFDVGSDTRTISSNQLSNHDVGNFPNADPTATTISRVLDLSPTYTGTAIYVYNETGPPTPSNANFWQFGIATNGVEFHPMGLKPWENPNDGEENWEWQAKVTEQNETSLDAFGAHVTSQGLYHYHGDIVGLAEEDGARHSLIYGFAADGFPIYYKYGYTSANDATTSIKELKSSYRLKSGARTGTGTAGADYPDGTHDGTYIQDFEFVDGLGDLDECNGRQGVTPEYPDGTYYYVITADFPVTPNCFFGTPDDDWKIGK
ncbi:MAG: YHYH protein [Bacteroidota bacterium]